MFKNVLIADDHDDINKSVVDILKAFGIQNIKSSQYCDDSFLKIKRAELDNIPFDLLITDLSFKKDHRECKLHSGEELIAALNDKKLNLSVIVYSMNDQLQIVRRLMNYPNVKAYVVKDRKGSLELKKAIKTVYSDQQYLSPDLRHALNSRNHLEIDDYDINLIKQLSHGHSQEEIGLKFAANGISPNSLSSIEKKINKLRFQFKANNTIHLVALAKDLGII